MAPAQDPPRSQERAKRYLKASWHTGRARGSRRQTGPYTAATVGSFAFGRQEVALDTNARRLFARLSATLAPPPGRAADFNQATMELGATTCTARAPRCGACPLRAAYDGPETPRVRARARERFEDSNRWVRGRVVAALAAGEGVP